jgi:hypothetical protein
MIQHATHAQDSYRIDPALWTRGRNAIAFVALISWIAAIAGFFLDPARFFQSYLVGFLFSIFIPLGGLFFLMVMFLTGSAWSVTMRRVVENMVVTLPLGFILCIPVLLGMSNLYHWAHPGAAEHDALLKAKEAWLNPTSFVYRTLIYFLLWSVWATRIYKHSTKQDTTKSLEQMHTISRWSAPGLLMLVLSGTLAAFDWSMSLDPHWYSTIFGLYCFAGGAFAFIATWLLILVALREKGVLRDTVNAEHYHDLGKWMLALTVFWAYIAFSQYLLIWYANIPEETVWFLHRFEGTWSWASALLLFGHFIFPFLVLVLRSTKRNLKALTLMAVWFLIIQYIDFYWQVMPTFYPHGVALHWLDVVCLVAPMSALALVFWSRMRAHALMPIGDPRFEQSLRFQNA